MLFDVAKLKSEEIELNNRYNKLLKAKSDDLRVITENHKEANSIYHSSLAVRHLQSRYPENFIDNLTLPISAEWYIDQYNQLLNASIDERPLQKFFQANPFMIASILQNTDFGHHKRYVFPQFQIANKYRPDFVVSGTNSQGYGWIFIELQSPNCHILLKNGQASEQAREGLHQIRTWQDWFGNHLDFAKTGMDMEGLHESRMLYYLIIGRRDNYQDEENKWRDREMKVDKSLRIISYDRLIDNFITVISNGNF